MISSAEKRPAIPLAEKTSRAAVEPGGNAGKIRVHASLATSPVFSPTVTCINPAALARGMLTPAYARLWQVAERRRCLKAKDEELESSANEVGVRPADLRREHCPRIVHCVICDCVERPPERAETPTCAHADVREQGPPLVTRLLLQVLTRSVEKAKEAVTTAERDLQRLVTEHTSALEPFRTAAAASETKQLELEQELRVRDEVLEGLRAELQVAPPPSRCRPSDPNSH
jgi:hypothetical protein